MGPQLIQARRPYKDWAQSVAIDYSFNSFRKKINCACCIYFTFKTEGEIIQNSRNFCSNVKCTKSQAGKPLFYFKWMTLWLYVRSTSCNTRELMKTSSIWLSMDVSRAPPPFTWSSFVRHRIDASAKLTGAPVNTWNEERIKGLFTRCDSNSDKTVSCVSLLLSYNVNTPPPTHTHLYQ